MNNRITLCPACEKLMREVYDLKRVSDGIYRPKEKADTCGFCGHKVVCLDTFEAKVKRGRPDAGA